MKNRKFHADVLGVSEDAGTKQIRRAYRKQAQLRHPDKRGGTLEAKADFQSLHDSYQYLLENPPKAKVKALAPEAKRARASAPPPAFRKSESPVTHLAHFFRLSLEQRIAVVGVPVVLLFTLGVIFFPKPKPSEPVAAPVSGKFHPSDAQLSLRQSLEVKPAAQTPQAGSAFVQQQCRISGIFEGKYQNFSSGDALSAKSCELSCENWLAKTEGGGGKCIWGDTVLRSVEGIPLQKCTALIVEERRAPDMSREIAMDWDSSKTNCSDRCEKEFSNFPGLAHKCEWGAEVLVDRKQLIVYLSPPPLRSAAEREEERTIAERTASAGALTNNASGPNEGSPPLQPVTSTWSHRTVPASHAKAVVKEAEVAPARKQILRSRDYSGVTDYQQMLFSAAAAGDLEGVKAAIANHADIDGKDSGDNTALHLALENDSEKVVSYLITQNADVNIINENGHSPLMLVADQILHMKYALALIYPGAADPSLTNKRGETALSITKTKGYTELQDYLESAETEQEFRRAVEEKSARLRKKQRSGTGSSRSRR